MISVIIPVYRSEATLERCIESVCRQTYRDLEIIMIVEGAPDASGILADRLAETDGRIRVIHQPNQGVSHARNTGIEAARGEYIQFVDSDDYVDSRLCESLLQSLQDFGAQMALCGFHHLYYGRDVVKLPECPNNLDLEESRKELLGLYEGGFLNMPWNKLFVKAAVRTKFRRDMDLGEDLLFNMAYLEHCERLAVVPEALCYYIQDGRGTTLSTKKRENRMENAIYLYEQMQDFSRRRYGTTKSEGVLETRLMSEFLDEMENLAFDGGMRAREKLEVIRRYYSGYERIRDKKVIRPVLLDYRILYFFFKRRCFRIMFLLILLRGLVVRLARSGKG